ncbi:inositol monophosphatase [bacterium]|nr:inositol monophosphatase [bacterium]
MDNDVFQFALNLVLDAGKLFKEGYHHPKEVKMKGQREMVTKTDEDIEKLIKDRFAERFPDIIFIGEEKSADAPFGKGRNIILDPVDGTMNFIHKIPFTAISLGFYEDAKGVFGMVYNPILEEFFVGVEGEGSYLNNDPIRVSKISTVNDYLLATGLPYDRTEHSNLDHISKIGPICRDIRRLGSAALDMCYTANGTFDGYWELGLKAWDVAAGAIIVNNAGGKVTNFNNGKLDLFAGDFLASNGKIHNEIHGLIKEGL